MKVNYNKSFIIQINVSKEKMEILARTFNYQVGTLPFTYLGLSLGINKPSVADCLPLVQCIERRLVACSQYLITQGGKLQMLNSLLFSLPTFDMCTIKVPLKIIEQIEKYMKRCLWRGSDMNARKPPQAAWEMVTRPKSEGVLEWLNW